MAEVALPFPDLDKQIKYTLYMNIMNDMRIPSRDPDHMERTLRDIILFDARIRAERGSPQDMDRYIERMEKLSDALNDLDPDSSDYSQKVFAVMHDMIIEINFLVEALNTFGTPAKKRQMPVEGIPYEKI